MDGLKNVTAGAQMPAVGTLGVEGWPLVPFSMLDVLRVGWLVGWLKSGVLCKLSKEIQICVFSIAAVYPDQCFQWSFFDIEKNQKNL